MDSSLVPEAVVNSATTTLANLENLETQLLQLLSLSNPETLADMPPLELRLRCNGINPEEHPVKTELERLNLYQEKLDRFINLSKAPLRPSTTLNYQAATRFIEHSLPDLTPEQKMNMRAISKGDGARMKYLERRAQRKRKYQSSGKSSVQAAASEFLQKAARELLGDNTSGFKGPLHVDMVDKDDLHDCRD